MSPQLGMIFGAFQHCGIAWFNLSNTPRKTKEEYELPTSQSVTWCVEQ